MNASHERWVFASDPRRLGDRLDPGAGTILVLTGPVVKHSALAN